MESSQNHIINKQTETLTKMDDELTDMALKMDTMDEGVKTSFSRVNKDLEALDGCVNHRCKDNDLAAEKLRIAKGKIEVLEERSRMQRDMIEKLITRVKSMEDRLCHCHEGKGKGKAVEISSSPVLGSPLVLDHPLAGSDGSYHTPPAASSPVVSSSSSSSDKKNVVVESRLVEIKDKVMESALHVPAPELDFQGIARLMAVHGQHAVCTQGPPKPSYHPYMCCCTIGDRVPSQRPGSLCLPSLLARRSPSSQGRARDEGYDSPSKLPHRMGSDGGWAQRF